jgi:hypothetical protein
MQTQLIVTGNKKWFHHWNPETPEIMQWEHKGSSHCAYFVSRTLPQDCNSYCVVGELLKPITLQSKIIGKTYICTTGPERCHRTDIQ